MSYLHRCQRICDRLGYTGNARAAVLAVAEIADAEERGAETAAPEPARLWVSIGEYVQATGLSRRTVERQVADKKLTHRRDGRRVLISAAELRRAA